MPSYDSFVAKNSLFQYKLPDAYIYLYHTDEYFILPQYPETITDNMESTFSSQNALSRTAPVFSYSNSGPRVVQVAFKLHRDMMNDINYGNTSIRANQGEDIIYSVDDDYIDLLIKKLQSIALPRYQASSKLVDPPQVAVRFGDNIFVKGVVNSGVSVSYDLPFLENNKYAQIGIQFQVSETQPYDADSVGRLGSFRGLTSGLQSKIAGTNGSGVSSNSSVSTGMRSSKGQTMNVMR